MQTIEEGVSAELGIDLVDVKSFESAIQIQLDYTKSASAAFAEKATKFAELYANLAKDILKPIESAISSVQLTKP